MIVAIHGLREYLDHPYRRLLDVFQEMYDTVEKLGLSVVELLDLMTVCTRKQELLMAVWRILLRESAALHDTGEIQATDLTNIAQRMSCYNCAKRVTD